MNIRAASLMVVIIVIAVIYLTIYLIGFSPDRQRYPVRGIDVSHHQGQIDWQRVASDDVAFAFIKASEGGDFVDKNFVGNATSARENGIVVGAYHFFTFCRPGDQQAHNILEQIEQVQLELPLVVDLEFVGNCSKRPSVAEMGQELRAFLDIVETKLGRDVMYYTTQGFVNSYGDAMPTRDLWIRWISIEPFWDDWTFWQYDDDAHVNGIVGPVDLNVFKFDKHAFDVFVAQ